MAAATGSANSPRFASTFPIGREPDGRVVLVYLVTEVWPERFRRFLQDHVPLLRLAPTWTLRLVFPRPLDRVYDAYQAVIRDELESPIHPGIVRELQKYFEGRRRAAHTPDHQRIDRGSCAGPEVLADATLRCAVQPLAEAGRCGVRGPLVIDHC